MEDLGVLAGRLSPLLVVEELLQLLRIANDLLSGSEQLLRLFLGREHFLFASEDPGEELRTGLEQRLGTLHEVGEAP